MLFSPYIGTKVPLMRTWFPESMLPSMVPPIIGPFNTPSRIVSCPFWRGNSARTRRKGTPLRPPREGHAFRPPRRPTRRQPIERSLALDGEIADVDQALSRAGFNRRRIHRQLKLAASQLAVSVGEAEECAGVIGLEIDHLAALRATAQIARQRRIASKLAAERKISDHTVAPR